MVSDHVPVMFGKRAGEEMTALVVAHKIERVAGGGVECRLDGRLAGRADGAARQTRVSVGIVRRVYLKFLLCDGI